MKRIYLNADFECSVSEKEDTVQSVETDFFDGKCKAFIEGYRFVPAGTQWARSDGTVFTGEMIAPFKDHKMLEMVQALYDELKGEMNAEV